MNEKEVFVLGARLGHRNSFASMIYTGAEVALAATSTGASGYSGTPPVSPKKYGKSRAKAKASRKASKQARRGKK